MSFDWLLLSDSVRGPSHWADCFCSAFQRCIHKTSPDFRGFPRVSPFTCWRCYPLCRADPLLGFLLPGTANQYMIAAFVLIPFANSSKLKLTPRNHTPDLPQLNRPTRPKESWLISPQQPGNQVLCDHPVCQLQQAEADAPKSHAGFATD